MEIIIKFIFGVSVVAFLINFLAIIGYMVFKLRDFLYMKHRVNILGALYFPRDGGYYDDCIFTGMYVIGVILFLLGSFYGIFKIGNIIYSLI